MCQILIYKQSIKTHFKENLFYTSKVPGWLSTEVFLQQKVIFAYFRHKHRKGRVRRAPVGLMVGLLLTFNVELNPL